MSYKKEHRINNPHEVQISKRLNKKIKHQRI